MFSNLKMGVILAVVFALGAKPVRGEVRLTPDEADKLLVENPEPTYPPIAAQAKLQDTVKFDITVSDNGTVVSSRVISGHPLLIGAAVDAVKKRKYRPYVLEGNARQFVTTVEVPFSLGIPKDDYEQQEKLAREFFKQEDICRGLLKVEKWKEAEEACKAALPLADKLADHRELEKMGAYEQVGYAVMYQSRFTEALQYFTRAFGFAQSKLNESDAELGRAYRNLAMANHGLKNLDRARELYAKAERSYQLAHAKIGMDELQQRYMKALRDVFKYHLLAAEQAGATAEAEEIKRQIQELP